jgi:hypothetical protein
MEALMSRSHAAAILISALALTGATSASAGDRTPATAQTA